MAEQQGRAARLWPWPSVSAVQKAAPNLTFLASVSSAVQRAEGRHAVLVRELVALIFYDSGVNISF